MIYAGIDIAKLNHFASVVSSDGEVLVKPFQFSNDLEGFRSLSLVLDKYSTIRSSSSSVLNQRPTTVITLSSSSLQKGTASVSSIRFRPRLRGRKTSA